MKCPFTVFLGLLELDGGGWSAAAPIVESIICIFKMGSLVINPICLDILRFEAKIMHQIKRKR